MRTFTLKSALAIAALLTVVGGPAAAGTVYNWSLSGVDNGTGNVSIDGSNNIVAFSGQIDGDPVNLMGGNPGVAGASVADSIPYLGFSSIIYDNVLFPLGDAGHCDSGPGVGLLDACGILFSMNGGYGNLYGVGGGPNGYAFFNDTGLGLASVNGGDTFGITPAPEPLDSLPLRRWRNWCSCNAAPQEDGLTKFA